MKLAFETKGERNAAIVLVALWALLFLPNLRTNPNWYGDEGEWMEKSWTFIHGTPRIGPIVDDFIFPYPYPPLYMVVNGVLLRLFGNDIVVARALGAVTALAAGALLFWIGTRLRDKNFGFLCAAAFLVYSEANINFRWVRSHPMSGVLALASIGFLIRYVQEKRLRDAAWAGIFCSLATAKIGRAPSELQSLAYLVCRLLLEKKKNTRQDRASKVGKRRALQTFCKRTAPDRTTQKPSGCT